MGSKKWGISTVDGYNVFFWSVRSTVYIYIYGEMFRDSLVMILGNYFLPSHIVDEKYLATPRVYETL